MRSSLLCPANLLEFEAAAALLDVLPALFAFLFARALGRAGAEGACLIPNCIEQLIGARLASGTNDARSHTSLLLAYLIENLTDVNCDTQTLSP